MNIKKIIVIIALLIVAILANFFISFFVATFRLKSVLGKSAFPIASILNISSDRVTEQVTTYNKDSLIEYDYLIDSLYCIHIVKIGKLDSNASSNYISFATKEFPSRDGWFVQRIASPFPFRVESSFNSSVQYCSGYNVYLLPMKQISKIDVYVDGKILDQDTITAEIISYSLKAKTISFAFNNINKKDMGSIYLGTTDSPISKMVFYKDKDSTLYIMNVTTLNGSEPDIKKLIKW